MALGRTNHLPPRHEPSECLGPSEPVSAVCNWCGIAPQGEGDTEMIQGSCLCRAVPWQFEGQPDGATACNRTACRRYGVLWAYDYEDEGIKVSGKTQAYV